MAEGIDYTDTRDSYQPKGTSSTVPAGKMQSGGPIECPSEGASPPSRTADVSFADSEIPKGGDISSPVDKA